MARLEAADMKAIYGDEYEAVVAREQSATKAPRSDSEKRAALALRMEANGTTRVSSLAVAFTGLMLALGSFYRTKGLDIAGYIGVAGIIAGCIWYVWLRQNAARWQDALKTTRL